MKIIIYFLFLLLLSQFSYSAADQKISTEQCRSASTQIIQISEEALKETESKKNVKKLEKLISKWKKRLDSKEDACDIYQSILKSSASF